MGAALTYHDFLNGAMATEASLSLAAIHAGAIFAAINDSISGIRAVSFNRLLQNSLQRVI